MLASFCVSVNRPPCDAHLHQGCAPALYDPHADAIGDYLKFRHWLRSHPEDRDLYEAKKRELAGRQWDDMNYDAVAKSEVITQILSRAAS
jgi:GrpB-like predicted nucleotidyltransferase (UPF0157 family)